MRECVFLVILLLSPSPLKEETVRIRKLLERFGAVGDANVFYWFQNGHPRSRRRQRQMQAAAAAAAAGASSSAANSSPAASATVGLPSIAVHPMAMGGSACQYEQQSSSSSSSGSTGGSSLGLFAHGAGVSGAVDGGYLQASCGASSVLASRLMGDVDSGGSDDLFAISRQMGFVENPRGSSSAAPSIAAQRQYYSGQLPAVMQTSRRSSLGLLEHGGGGGGGGGGGWGAGEPVPSRWTPKQEQILILESIFNSGMVNPPKEVTVHIHKLLERFGTVGDANVFYWRAGGREPATAATTARQKKNNEEDKLSLSHLCLTSGPSPISDEKLGGFDPRGNLI